MKCHGESQFTLIQSLESFNLDALMNQNFPSKEDRDHIICKQGDALRNIFCNKSFKILDFIDT